MRRYSCKHTEKLMPYDGETIHIDLRINFSNSTGKRVRMFRNLTEN